jgi:AGCS family alanine or glycine:cation symporter
MKKYISSIFLLLSFALFSQELVVKGSIYNPSKNINDGVIKLEVDGGTPPYQFKWSNQNTPLTANQATNLIEGLPYTVTVTDAKGLQVTKVFKVPTEAITEFFNGVMTPAVSALGSVLFWDPFAAIGIYDPVVYADVKRIGIPGWSPETKDKFILKEWLKPEGRKVKAGDEIAIISKNDGTTETITSSVSGELRHLAKEGGVIYN